jgi:queuine tRNA-ribosyltransferase
MVCNRYSRAYIRHLFNASEPLAAVLATLHNLAHYLDLMQQVRDAIQLGTLSALLGQVRSRNLDAAAQTG